MTANLFPQSNVDRPLIAFAFLTQTTNTTGDLLSGLVPIFKPIARSRVGKRFDPAEFAKEVARLYSLDVHPWAAEDLAPRLERAGLLRQQPVGTSGYEYYYAEIEGEFNEVSENDIRLIVRKFIEFSTLILQEHGHPIDEKSLENGLFDELIKMDFWAVLRKPDQSKQDQITAKTLHIKKSQEQLNYENKISAEARIDVLCASFILHLHYRESALYDLLVKIASGAMVAEAVLNFQNPGNSENLSKLRVVLDTPLVMSLLDLASEESHKYTKRLCDSLKERGAQLVTFTHSVEELVANLKAVVSLCDQGSGFGPTARRFAKASFRTYVESVRADPTSALLSSDVKIITPLSSPNAYQFFSEEDEEKFRQLLGEYQNPAAQRRDAASIASLIRLRGGKRIRMTHFHSAESVFLTENAWIPPRAEIFLKKRNLAADGEVPVAITDKYLAGLLLVMYGGKAEEVTRSRLLAHCAAALEARSDVIARMQRFLSNLGQVEGDRFKALMTVERAGQHLMQLTLGDSVFVTDSNAAKILEDVEAILIEKATIASEAKIKAAEEAHKKVIAEAQERLIAKDLEAQQEISRIAEARKILENKVLAAETEAMISRNDARLAANKASDTARQLEDKKSAELERLRKSIMEAINFSNLIEKFLHIFFATIIAVLTAYLAYLGSAKSEDISLTLRNAIPFLSGLIAFIGFWKLPDRIFGNSFMLIKEKAFSYKTKSLLLTPEEIQKFNIDLRTNSATAK